VYLWSGPARLFLLMKFAFLPAVCAALLALGATRPAAAAPAPAGKILTFHGKVYQVDTIYDNVDVIMPDRTRTLWADATTQVRLHGKRANLIDIAMGDKVSGTYVRGPKGNLMLVTIVDQAGK
jgi:hypothetical protein